MPRLLLSVLLLWLTGCNTLVRLQMQPTPATYYHTEESVTMRSASGGQLFTFNPRSNLQVIGMYGGNFVVSYGWNKVLLVPASSIYPGSIEEADARRVAVPSLTPSGSYSSQPATSGASTSGGYGTPFNHTIITGPRGGQYYINGNGNRTYLTPQSTINSNTIHTGSRGGQYYINGNGNRTYIRRR